MEGRREYVKFLKFLKRRGFLNGKAITMGEFKGLRLRYALTREQLAHWLSTAPDVLAQAETEPRQFVDGGLHSALIQQIKQLPAAQPEVEVPVESIEVARPVPEPVLEPVVETALDAASARILARVVALDLKDPSLRTIDQRFQRFITFWIEENKVKKFSMSKSAKFMVLPKTLRARVLPILGGNDSQLLDNWRLFRHVQLKTKHKMALSAVLMGDVGASSALSEFDEKGRKTSMRPHRKKTGKKKVTTKTTRRRIQAMSESSASLTVAKPKTSSKKKIQKELRAAQAVQEAVGAFKLRLDAIKSEFSGDSAVTGAIEGITSSVDPIHTKLKQLVLRRATKARAK